MASGRGGLAKGAPAALLIPGKVSAEPDEEYDDDAAADDATRGADLFRAICEAKDARDYEAGALALGDFLDWYMGEEPEEEGPKSGSM